MRTDAKGRGARWAFVNGTVPSPVVFTSLTQLLIIDNRQFSFQWNTIPPSSTIDFLGMEKLFGLWQNISDSRTPHFIQIQWCLLQMEFLGVQVVLVFSLSFVNLPGVHSLSVLGLDAAHYCSESLEWPVWQCFRSNSSVQLSYSWLELRQLLSY